MSDLINGVVTDLIQSPKKETSTKPAVKTVVKTVIKEVIKEVPIKVEDMTIEQVTELQKQVTARKQELVPKKETAEHVKAKRDEASAILNEIMGMNKSWNLIKKKYEANAAYFDAFTDKPEDLKTGRIDFMLKTLKNFTMFLKKDIPSVSPRLVLDKIISLASMDAKYDKLRIDAQNLLKGK